MCLFHLILNFTSNCLKNKVWFTLSHVLYFSGWWSLWQALPVSVLLGVWTDSTFTELDVLKHKQHTQVLSCVGDSYLILKHHCFVLCQLFFCKMLLLDDTVRTKCSLLYLFQLSKLEVINSIRSGTAAVCCSWIFSLPLQGCR